MLAIAFIAACRTAQPVQTPAAGGASFGHNGAAWGALWQQRAGEYRALCYQAYRLATLQLDAELQRPSSLPRAIVTDIDETVLDNSAYTAMQSGFHNGYTEETWKNWTDLAVADTVPGACSFLRYAASKGVRVFYITNRNEAERKATLENLQRFHFPDADDAHLLLKTTTSGKEARRQTVVQTHHIVMLMGDNLGDFSDVFDKRPADARQLTADSLQAAFGARYIVLPNAMYGDWEGGLINYNYQLTQPQKDAIYKSALKDYPRPRVPRDKVR